MNVNPLLAADLSFDRNSLTFALVGGSLACTVFAFQDDQFQGCHTRSDNPCLIAPQNLTHDERCTGGEKQHRH